MSKDDHCLTDRTETGSVKIRLSWAMYDFANSPFPTVIITAVYVLYFKNVVVGEAEFGRSDNLWGAANSIAAAIVFFLAPILGAIADIGGKKRLFLTAFTVLAVASTACLSMTKAGTVGLAMFFVIIGVVGFEGSLVFYNAFLPELTDKSNIGKLSGQGWALGYVGGLGCLLLVLPMADNYLVEIPLVVAMWYLVFSLPALLWLRDRPVVGATAFELFQKGTQRLFETLKMMRLKKTLKSPDIQGDYRQLFRFLIAYFFYNNAVITIIVFAVAFSSETLQFATKESILLIAAMNVVASPGAFVFGILSDRIGAKPTIVITLLMWLIVVFGAEVAAWPGLFTVSQAKLVFWGVAIMASLCIGATQATSRGFVGQLAPDNQAAEFYGFMAFAGKGSAILGPLVFGLASDIFNSQRVAVATIGFFFLIGLILLLKVPAETQKS